MSNVRSCAKRPFAKRLTSAKCQIWTPRQATSLFDQLVGKAPQAVAPMLSAMNSHRFIRSPRALFADLATDDIAEQFPTLALEFPELKFLDRSEVIRALRLRLSSTTGAIVAVWSSTCSEFLKYRSLRSSREVSIDQMVTLHSNA